MTERLGRLFGYILAGLAIGLVTLFLVVMIVWGLILLRHLLLEL